MGQSSSSLDGKDVANASLVTDQDVINSNQSGKILHELDQVTFNRTNTNSNDLINSSENFGTGSFKNESSFEFLDFITASKWITRDTLVSWVHFLASAAMVTGCVLPYVPQYISIFKSHNSSGFSTYVCLTLLIANITRIAFWFGRPFEIALIIQSIMMIATQLLLLELCVRVKRDNDGISLVKKSIFSCQYRTFWAWTDILSYVVFVIIYSTIIGTAMYLFKHHELFVETVGFASTLSEAMLGLPQVLKNNQKKSVVGMSLGMVLMWLAGDLYKTAYFILTASPLQFWLCGALQITIDLLILFQVCLYRQNVPLKIDAQSSESHKEMVTL